MPSPLDQPEAATPAPAEPDSTNPNIPESLSTKAKPLAIEGNQVKDKAEDEVTVLDVGGGNVVKLDRLGPMIINSDGTLSRIQNWQELHPIEQERTVRLLVKKRNLVRLQKLDAENKAEGEAVSALQDKS
ncbi:hypothetical protein BD324DRAFT_652030 [Kockovaella imperatae]|uniref:Uncharacterized protein n=1 Tax=Kockovaella imperatae TaxID=4999 RepID=A0A1Y1UF14_9TREE|nr:hypothetical protein BD324DRAFT_652030 [Kockovaella imperatae]ORX36127.1 hypothetical protein BD324DRAFT_652030 [Kockovaella imperatae]